MSELRPVQPLPTVDAVRLLSAAWVGFSHLGGPPVDELARLAGFSILAGHLSKAVATAFCGPAAVVVFFVISGFCIHYPYAKGQAFHWCGFLVSRLTRILLPMLAAIGIFRLCAQIDKLQLILWSIYCEMIYYCVSSTEDHLWTHRRA